jgi:hypothetical protein
MGQIGKPRTFISQLLPPAEWVDLLKNSFFSAVACHESIFAECDHVVHQSLKAGHHLWCFPFVIYPQREQMFFGPFGRIGKVHKELSPGGNFLGTLEGGLGIFIFAVVPQTRP